MYVYIYMYVCVYIYIYTHLIHTAVLSQISKFFSSLCLRNIPGSCKGFCLMYSLIYFYFFFVVLFPVEDWNCCSLYSVRASAEFS